MPSRALFRIDAERRASTRPRGWLAGSVSVLILLVIWQSAVGSSRGSPLPSPTEVLVALWQWASTGRLFADASASLIRVALGFMVAATAAVAFGLLFALSRPLRRHCAPLLEFVRPVPPIAWIGLAILWFGLGDRAAVFLVFLGAFFPIFTNTMAGVLSVRMAHINTARCLGAGEWLIVREVLLPAAMPLIFIGLRTGLGVGWMSLIAAEMVGAQSGLGYAIQTSRILLNTEQVVAGMLMIGLLGFLLNGVITIVGARMTAWHRDTLRSGEDPQQ